MPRVKASPKKCVKTSNSHVASSSWVFLVKGNSSQNVEGFIPDVVKLKHPASNQPSMFAFSPGNLTVQEVLSFDENKRSWFLNDNIKYDGKMHLSTPIDPIFLVLPYLKNAQQVQPLEQCLWDEEYPETFRLAQCKHLKLSFVADRKGEESLQAFKYNEEKTMSWLRKKIDRVVQVLKEKGIHVSQGAVSATYVKSIKYESNVESDYIRYAYGIITEYLTDDLAKKLAHDLKIPEELSKKRKLNSPTDTNDEKRPKLDTSEEDLVPRTKALDLTKPEKVQKTATMSKKELAKQKAAASSKSITNFFKKT